MKHKCFIKSCNNDSTIQIGPTRQGLIGFFCKEHTPRLDPLGKAYPSREHLRALKRKSKYETQIKAKI